MDRFSESEIEREVSRRVESIQSQPDTLARYDLTADGAIDDDELALLERMVRLEVTTERSLEHDDYSMTVDPHTLQDRFELTGMLGRGGQGITYLARDLEAEQHVVVKQLRLRDVDAWKAIELFEREANVLESLSHPQIPAYIDAFTLSDEEDGLRFYLVQAFIDGQSVEEHIEDGQRYTEDDVVELLQSMAGVLDYLHGQKPPVVHRDIKPSNIMRGRDGQYHLVDFGAVQAVLPETVGGSTVLGTSGYVPFEQFRGKAEPRSDIYALAATAAHLLSGVHPVDFDFVGPHVQLPGSFSASDGLTKWVENSLSPDPRERPATFDREAVELPLVTTKKAESNALAKRPKPSELRPVEPPIAPNIVIFRDGRDRKMVQLQSGEQLLGEIVDWSGDVDVRLAVGHRRAGMLKAFPLTILAFLPVLAAPKFWPFAALLTAIAFIYFGNVVRYSRVSMSQETFKFNNQPVDWDDVVGFRVKHANGDHHDAQIFLDLKDRSLHVGKNLPSKSALEFVKRLGTHLRRLKGRRR